MIAYVESNFVLEIALGQEQSPAAQSILLLAQHGEIEIAVPSFALSEPFSTVRQRDRTRRQLYASLTNQLNELSRSIPHRSDVTSLRPVLPALTNVGVREDALLAETVGRLLDLGRSIPVDRDSFALSRQLRAQAGLADLDSIILASVLSDLPNRPAGETKWFVSRNWKDFNNPFVVDELHRFNCRYSDHFEKALAEIQTALAQ